MRFLRGGAILLLGLAWPGSLAQPAAEQMPSFKPDVTLVVREHPMSAELVEVTAFRPDYPSDLLQDQIETLGRELGSAPRGLIVRKATLDEGNPNLTFVKATFAVDGLIDREAQVLRLQPILRAFAGAPDPFTVDELLILFDGEKPGPRTVKSHITDSVEARATFVAAPAEIEYRVLLKSQDPSKILFPDQADERKAPAEPSGKQSGPSPVFYAALLAGALAVGALVYLALLRGGGRDTRAGR
jgi:hypothetical protein